jgi:hypothetical protein
VAAERTNHELLEWTAPWELLWAVNPECTKREILGLQYHFHSADPSKDEWLFNRHATWATADYQKGGQPWIKHSGLYCHAYAFLAAKTDGSTLKQAQGIGALYWNHRNPATGLMEGCLTDPRPTSRQATLSGTAQLAYYLLKAYQCRPEQAEWRERALTMLKTMDRYSYDAKKKAFADHLNADGTAVPEENNPWVFAYSSGSGLLRFGRVAAYAARTMKDKECLEIARRSAEAMRAFPIPEKFTPEEIGFALNLSLDLYDLTQDASHLTDARRYADAAVEKLMFNGLVRRLPGDHFYEAKLGAGDLLAGLLRLHLRLHPELKDPGVYDWSF